MSNGKIGKIMDDQSFNNFEEKDKEVLASENIEYSVVVEDLNIGFPLNKNLIVKNVSFKVKKGEINGFLGISGAGKTTIIRVLTCQIPKKFWKGTVRIAGLDPAQKKNKSMILSKIGYVPQLEELNLYYDLSPLVNIEIFASTYGKSSEEAKKIGEELFKILDIPEDTWNKPVRNMSGGEKKRLSMAIGMIHEPEILFLDEPTTGVDASKRYEILGYLKKLNRRLGTTMVIITHDLEAAHICDTVAILKQGVLLEFGPPQQLIETLPSKGLIAKLVIKDITQEKIDIIKNFPPIKMIMRSGNNAIEVFMDNFNDNLGPLIKYCIENEIYVGNISRDLATFRRYFQIRIQEEEEKNK
ncbi:MAG: ABC transporter ATP-binding protein [Promethearchaeota archaeon]